MATFCPTCRGIMRPKRGVLECIRCSQGARARTVLKKGKSIRLGQGQVALARDVRGAEPTLAPRSSTWRPRSGGEPHAQWGLFPHDEIRLGQKRMTRDVMLTLQRGGHLVAQAPTGIGKTAASLAPALQHALDTGRTVLFLTSRQSQHRIAVDTLRRVQDERGARFTLVDLVAKRDMCLRSEAADLHPARFPDFCSRETRTRSCRFLGEADEGSLAEVRQGVLHVEELMQVGKQAGLCPHILALAAARQAQVVVADYNHLFSDIREASLERIGRALSDLVVVVDEAHNLPDRIRANHAHRVTPFLLDQVESEAKQYRIKDVQGDVRALRAALESLVEEAQRDGTMEKARLGDGARHVARLAIDDLHQAFEAARNRGTLGLRRTLQDAIEAMGPLVKKTKQGTDAVVHAETLVQALEDWGRFGHGALRYVERDDGGAIALHARLLDPGVAAKKVFAGVHSAILMSGTLRPPEMARDLLGLEASRTTVRQYPSPFPSQHRLVTIGTGFSTRYRDRTDEQWRRMGQEVTNLCRATRGNVALFAPSYAILGDLRLAIEDGGIDKELLLERPGMTKGDRDQYLDALAGAKKRRGALLLGVIGGSFSEGVDFRDNLLSAVVVAGLPLAPPDLEVEATIEHLERSHPGKGRAYGYVLPAMNKVLQAMGRGIRSATDRCAFVLLDERYQRPPYRQLLPDEPQPIATPAPGALAARFVQANGL